MVPIIKMIDNKLLILYKWLLCITADQNMGYYYLSSRNNQMIGGKILKWAVTLFGN